MIGNIYQANTNQKKAIVPLLISKGNSDGEKYTAKHRRITLEKTNFKGEESFKK